MKVVFYIYIVKQIKTNIMTTSLENQIKNLKAGRTLAEIKVQDIKMYYKIKGLASKLSEEKAYAKGNFITKNHLVEYKGLIIWMLKNKVNYKNYLNLSEAMTLLLETVESKKIVFKTKKGIKSIIVDLTIKCGLDNIDQNLRKMNGISVLENTFGNPILEDFTQHRLNVLMNK